MGTYPKHNHREPVTVIGLGLMGSALAEAFLENDHPTTVWNRTAEKAAPLVAKGAVHALNLTEAVTASTLVVVCVSTYEAAHEILDPLGEAFSGRVLVNLTSGTPDQARAMAAWAAEHTIDYLDGAIMAVPPMIGQPEASLLYSGSETVFTAHEPTLLHLGTPVYLGTDPGLALLYDVALLGMMWSSLGGFYHAAALVETAGIDATTFAPLAAETLSVVASWLPDEAREIDEGRYETDVSTLETNKAAIAHLIHTNQAHGTNADLTAPTQSRIDRRVAEGHGADSLASVIELIKKPISTP